MSKSKFRILVVDDDIFFANYVANLLADIEGFVVTQSHSVEEALKLARRGKFHLVVVDLKMPPGKTFNSVDTSGGHKTGLVLAREIKRVSPMAKVLIHSATPDGELAHLPFKGDRAAFLHKSSTPAELIQTVRRLVDPSLLRQKSFIVHGRDKKTALELKNYLQNRLAFEEPTILDEQGFSGMTIIEKFETYASGVDWVFVLLTPDDTGRLTGTSECVNHRARQNVIFELGYFNGLLRRRSGRIVLLYKGSLEIPSDLNGVGYIDISNGIEAASEDIRRNLVNRI